MKTLIIAEAGVNHNGDMELAKQLIGHAAAAGADLVKFQTFHASKIVSASAPKAEYQKETTGADESQLSMISKLQLSIADHEMLIRECKRHGIGFFSTAFDSESFDLLSTLGCVKLVKIPSGEITNLPLLRHMTRLGCPVLLSTGMATLGEIEAAINVIECSGTPRAKITVLHCTTEYPTPMEDVNLMAMVNLKHTFGVKVGYSDHTRGIEVPIAAVALGATVVEKHFTINRSLPGPDHKASLEPGELTSMISAIRNIERALGDGIKRPTESELRNRAVARKSIVASRSIEKGEFFSVDNLTAKRPGTGLSPMSWDSLIGTVANRNYCVDEMIQP